MKVSHHAPFPSLAIEAIRNLNEICMLYQRHLEFSKKSQKVQFCELQVSGLTV